MFEMGSWHCFVLFMHACMYVFMYVYMYTRPYVCAYYFIIARHSCMDWWTITVLCVCSDDNLCNGLLFPTVSDILYEYWLGSRGNLSYGTTEHAML